MLGSLRVEQGKKIEIVHAAVCCHKQPPPIFFIGRKEGSVVEMHKNEAMTAVTLLVLLSNERERAIIFEEELCNADVRAAREEAGVLDELGLLHVVFHVRRSSLEGLPDVHQPEFHSIVEDATDEVYEWGAGPEHGRMELL